MAASSEKEEKSKKLTQEFLQLRSNALKRGLSDQQVREATKNPSAKSGRDGRDVCCSDKTWWGKLETFVLTHRVAVAVALMATVVGALTTAYHLFLWEYAATTPCLVENNVFTDEMYRPPVNCDMCRDVHRVPEEKDLSPTDFYSKYAFTGRPVLVKGATANWTAMDHFSFKFLQKLYRDTKGSLETIEEECQFFPYETEFLTLEQAFSMSDDRAAFQPGQLPWYIGWSNCHEGVGKELRKHYQRPYFLPADSESVAEDWIFMGGPGPGANIHLDYVDRPSWQAQISGRKTWQLVPSPECESVCHSFNVTVHRGDIIVLDTNIWYHATFVHPGEISITIGSEFD